MDLNTIGKRIHYLRTKKGLSMSELGKKIGTDSANISNWEKDNRIPGGKFILSLSNFFGVSADWILKGDQCHSTQHTNDFFLDENREVFSQIDKLNHEDKELLNEIIKLFVQKKTS